MSLEVRIERAAEAKRRAEAAERAYCEALAVAHESGASWREIGRALGLAASTCMRHALKVRPEGWEYRVVAVRRGGEG